jgi:alkanesulfonate monooxygenase SsuD/methylene tetrahydromethanopterin reductase-like flavin-dependent oxidoreductase (luciferase family)
MHFGLFSLMTQRDLSRAPADIYSDAVEHVRAVEQIGFEIAWFAEHHFSNYSLCPSPLAMSMYMSARTTRIKVGPGVIVVPFYEPIRLLEDIAMTDQVSGGRLILGFGTGYQRHAFQRFGLDPVDAGNQLLDFLDLLDQYLGSESVALDTERAFLPETSFALRPKQPLPPIYVTGICGRPDYWPRAVKRGYIPFVTARFDTLETMRGVRDALVAGHVEAGGDGERVPFAIQRYVFIADSHDEAMRAADGARYIRRIAMAMRTDQAMQSGGFVAETPAPGELPLEEIINRLLIGSSECVAEQLAREMEILRPTHISCIMAIPGMTQRETMQSIERFGSEVMPQLEQRFGCLRAI